MAFAKASQGKGQSKVNLSLLIGVTIQRLVGMGSTPFWGYMLFMVAAFFHISSRQLPVAGRGQVKSIVRPVLLWTGGLLCSVCPSSGLTHAVIVPSDNAAWLCFYSDQPNPDAWQELEAAD